MASKVNLALRDLPRFSGVAEAAALRGRIQAGHEIDYLERAYDAGSTAPISESPYLEFTIPTLSDPSLAPAGRARALGLRAVHAAQAAAAVPAAERRAAIAERTLRVLEEHAPGLRSLVEHVEVLTPEDLETHYGLTGGHPCHGEHALDQLFTMRPLLGLAGLSHADRGPVPVQRRHASGRRHHRPARPQRRARHRQGTREPEVLK